MSRGARSDLSRVFSLPSLRSGGAAFWQRAFASDFAWKVGETFATRVFLIGVGVVASVMVARALGPEGRGLYAVAGALAGMGVQFRNLGLHSANTYFAAGNRRLLPRLAGNSLAVSAALGAVAVGALWGIAFLRPDIAPLSGTLLLLTSASIPIGLAYLLLQNLLIGVQEVRAFNRIEIVTRLLSLTLIALAILQGSVSPEALFAAGPADSAAGLAWALCPLWRHTPVVTPPSAVVTCAPLVSGLKPDPAMLFA